MGGAIQISALPLRPVNPSGRMPTIVSGTSLTVSEPPTAVGSPPSVRFQSAAPINATGWAPAAVSSPAANRRPAIGCTRSALKYPLVTVSLSTCAGSPRPLMVSNGPENDPIESNDVAVCSSAVMLDNDQRRRCRPSRALVRVLNRMTSRSGSAKGGGRSSIACTTLNIVVVAPMPSASVAIARAATARMRASVRTA